MSVSKSFRTVVAPVFLKSSMQWMLLNLALVTIPGALVEVLGMLLNLALV
jgi:hypothetical protein